MKRPAALRPPRLSEAQKLLERQSSTSPGSTSPALSPSTSPSRSLAASFSMSILPPPTPMAGSREASTSPARVDSTPFIKAPLQRAAAPGVAASNAPPRAALKKR